jgi:hypothetical protein
LRSASNRGDTSLAEKVAIVLNAHARASHVEGLATIIVVAADDGRRQKKRVLRTERRRKSMTGRRPSRAF